MIETVLVLPLVMLVIVLLIYLGWNYRRFALVTNMDRYAVWEQVTPGSPGPDIQRRADEIRNPRLNMAFFGLHDDEAIQLDEWRYNEGYTPQAHEDLRDQQSDETYSYFDAFLDGGEDEAGGAPRAIRERFVAKHEPMSRAIETLGLSDTMRAKAGHSRLNGDWRYANGVRYSGQEEKWVPASYRVSPGEALREVFFIDLDERLETLDNDGNELAQAIRGFYTRYPGYAGPAVGVTDRRRTGGWEGWGRWGQR